MSEQPKPTKVYVSYHEADQAWVEAELWPRLSSAGVQYVDRSSFRRQEPELAEMSRCVADSRYTLLVVTPSYLADSYSRFATVLVIQYGLDRKCWLAIPLIKDEGLELPVYLSTSARVDLSNGAAWDDLIEAINREPPVSADLTDPAYMNAHRAQENQPKISAGLEALRELIEIREVRNAVEKYHEDFEYASSQIQIIADYKTMHDKLHDIEIGHFRLLVIALATLEQEQTQPDEQEQTQSDLIGYESDLQLKVEEIQQIALRSTFADVENAWVTNLTDAVKFLTQAKEGNDKKALRRAVGKIRTVIGYEPSNINSRLIEAARKLRLAELVYAMVGVREQLNTQVLDAAKVEKFAVAIDHLADFYYRLETLKKEHDRWQTVDRDLRRIRDNISDKDIWELENSWPGLRRYASEKLYGRRTEDWATKMAAFDAEISSALADGNISKAKTAFQNFTSRAQGQFYRVDKALLSVCEDLRVVGTNLASVVEVLRRLSGD